ncbi:sodium:solute symporter [Mongoliibacter ruber]|uniref:SSS family solute:Na+ symporter n=1 Tax=Mongoliibacter ruber TaxID=1750599 RepID=A0A2T0WR68_9BACT|nr:sodium:solute symporter [Mongoliibacter ruber]PRY89167.1 SSS family solute:Na+ symporter [Mongoliibacter ruber]
MGLPVFDTLVFLFYMLGIIGFGISFYFKKRGSTEYITGGGRLPTWALGMSIFATYVSSISFLALPGSAYQSNWNGFVFSLSIPLAAWIAVTFFVPLYRKIQSPSAYAYLENRFGLWARVYASVCYLLTQLARMGAIMYLLALPMHALFGWSIPSIIIFTGLAVTLYAVMGGIEAVVWTDAVQGLLLIVGAVGCLLWIVSQMPQGVGQLIEIGKAEQKFSLGSMGLDFGNNTFWVILIYGFFINLQNFGVDQSYIQRYLGATTDREAKKSTWLGSILYVPVSMLFFMIGTALYGYFKVYDNLLSEELLLIENADQVFPFFIVNSLPSGITGLMIAAIFAAGMSTMSTSINSSATVILEDHVKKYFKLNIDEKASMRVLYLSSISVGLVSILVALAFNGVSSALEAWWALASIFSGGILGLFLLGVMTQVQSKIAPIAGVVVGLALIGWISLDGLILFLPTLGLHKNLAIVLGTMAIFILGFSIGLLSKKPLDSQETYQ